MHDGIRTQAGDRAQHHRQQAPRPVHEIELDVDHRPLEYHQRLPVHLLKGPGLMTQQVLKTHAKQLIARVADPAAEGRVGASDAPVFCR
ncbi:hypothetical protein D3C81_1778600 [compost metagenome]